MARSEHAHDRVDASERRDVLREVLEMLLASLTNDIGVDTIRTEAQAETVSVADGGLWMKHELTGRRRVTIDYEYAPLDHFAPPRTTQPG